MALLMLSSIQGAGGRFTVLVLMGAEAFMLFFITSVKVAICLSTLSVAKISNSDDSLAICSQSNLGS